jgi:hypothetical protein
MSLFPLSAAAKKTFWRGLKHPLFISLVGAFAATILIPGIVARSNSRAVLSKAKIDYALDLMKSSDSVNTAINKIKSEFEGFEKGSLSASPEDFNKRREECGRRIVKFQSQLDDLAWTWTWGASFRARVLKLISEDDFNKLQSYNSKYNDNVVATSAVLDAPRNAYLKAEAAQPARGTAPIMRALDQDLRRLQSEREELVRKMVAVFQKPFAHFE